MNVAPYKNTQGTAQFSGFYQGNYGADNNEGYFGQQGQPDGMAPTNMLAQSIYGQMGQQESDGAGNTQNSQLQALRQQLQQIPGTPQQQQQQMAQQMSFGQQSQQPNPFGQPQQQQQQPQQNLPTPINVDSVTANSPHWQHQMQLAQVSRQSNMPHFYARNAASSSRQMAMGNEQSNGGSTIVEITKAVLASVPDDLKPVEHQQNEYSRRPVVEKREMDEEAEDQRIRIKDNDAQLWTGLDLSGQQLTSMSPRLFDYTFLRRLFLNGNQLAEVPKAVVKLKSLRILDLSSNNLKEVPSELGMLFNLKYLYLFDNDLADLPWSFGNLEALEFLGIEGNPRMNTTVVETIAKKGTRGLIIHLRDDAPLLTPPEARSWFPVDEDGEPDYESSKPAPEVDLSVKEDKRFTLMSYNTLCQHYATPKMYKYTPSWALMWEYRRKKLTEEITGYKPQVICLQEVETQTYEEYWLPLLEKRGYKGVFYSKGRAKTMGEKLAKKVDGCATFYLSSVFTLVGKRQMDYSGLVMTQDKFKKTEDLFNRMANKDNVALVSVLQHTATGTKVVVANTHLHWDPEYNDVKTMQVAVLLDELQATVRKYTGSRDDYNKMPLVICGDFNSQRDSAVYELIAQGASKNHTDMRGRDYGRYTSDGFTHPFHLSSAYNCVGELPFTNFTPTFTEVIDYIWYSTQPLSVRGLLGPEDQKYADKVIGFPAAEAPSDHIPLIAQFEISKRSPVEARKKPDFGTRKT